MTRREAKAAGERYYDTCKPCPHGHIPTTRRTTDGACLVCERISYRTKYLADPAKYHAAGRRWKERNADKVAAYVEATKPQRAVSRATYRKTNRTELVAKKREWRHNNPEKERAQRQRFSVRHKAVLAQRFAAWAKSNALHMRIKAQNRRAKKLSAGSHTKQDVLALVAKQRGRCVYCSCDIRKRYTVDHIMPLFLGGSNNADNLQLVCKPCNSRKGAKHPLDFAKAIGRLV